jgi:hypothetical protein
VQGMKSQLTSIANAVGAVSESLDDLRRGVLRRGVPRAVGDIEAQLSVTTDATA